MRQANISPPIGGQAQINDKTISQMQEIKDVEKVMPQIAAVGRVSFNNSISDVVVYGVTADHLVHSAIKPSSGKLFDNNQISTKNIITTPQVAGATIKEAQGATFGDRIHLVDYSIKQSIWVRVRDTPSTQGKIIGYTRRSEAVQSGEEVWGSEYIGNSRPASTDSSGQTLNPWLYSQVRLWEKTVCEDTDPDCEDGQYRIVRAENGLQSREEGYFAVLEIEFSH